MTTATPSVPGILQRGYALTTAGAWGLVFLAAFESLAITTIMPIVTSDLDGRGLYSLAFSATIAAGVVGMVVAGSWADASGPAVPLLTAIGLFTTGLLVAGTADSMATFVSGRFLQGLGAGGITVTLYVLIAKVYPVALHIKIFGAFASAWVLPSMVGPFAAGVVADALGWPWVFLGVIVLVAGATAMIAPALRGHGQDTGQPPPAGRGAVAARPRAFDHRRVVAALVVAAAVVAVSSGAELDPLLAWSLAPPVIHVIAFAARGLLPPGIYRIRPGLPAVVLLGAAAGAVFFGTEVYLPLLLQERYELPTWLSGITLTAAAIAWALASAVQGHLAERIRPGAALRWGAGFLAAGTITVLLTAGLTWTPVLAAAGWFVAGAGMGSLYPRISTLVLAMSPRGQEGFNTSAKSIADSLGASVSLALAGLIFAIHPDATTRTPYVGVLVFTGAIGVAVLVLSFRARA